MSKKKKKKSFLPKFLKFCGKLTLSVLKFPFKGKGNFLASLLMCACALGYLNHLGYGYQIEATRRWIVHFSNITGVTQLIPSLSVLALMIFGVSIMFRPFTKRSK